MLYAAIRSGIRSRRLAAVAAGVPLLVGAHRGGEGHENSVFPDPIDESGGGQHLAYVELCPRERENDASIGQRLTYVFEGVDACQVDFGLAASTEASARRLKSSALAKNSGAS
jgi:hypothetical protein